VAWKYSSVCALDFDRGRYFDALCSRTSDLRDAWHPSFSLFLIHTRLEGGSWYVNNRVIEAWNTSLF